MSARAKPISIGSLKIPQELLTGTVSIADTEAEVLDVATVHIASVTSLSIAAASAFEDKGRVRSGCSLGDRGGDDKSGEE